MIKNEDYYSYFNDRYKLRQSTNGWFRIVDGSKNGALAVNFIKGVVKNFSSGSVMRCYNFIQRAESVDSHSDLIDIIKSATSATMPAFVERAKIQGDIKLPKLIAIYADDIIASKARDYMLGRGFKLEQLIMNGIAVVDPYDEDYAGRIMIPYTSDGKLEYYTTRAYAGALPKYKNPAIPKAGVLFNSDCMYLYDEVYVVEGALDAIRLGDDCIAVSSKFVSQLQAARMIEATASLFIFVPDLGAEKEFIQAAINIMDYKQVKVLNTTKLMKHGSDPDEWGRKRIKKLAKRTPIAKYTYLINKLMNL